MVYLLLFAYEGRADLLAPLGDTAPPEPRPPAPGPRTPTHIVDQLGIIMFVTNWEYARLDYRAAGTFGVDKFMDWTATFHHPGGVLRWGTDERFDDLKHLN